LEVSLPERFGRRQGYAFITFGDAQDVEKAVVEMNGKELLGREMKVQKATSGGPYAAENGEHSESGGSSIKKPRRKAASKVYLLCSPTVSFCFSSFAFSRPSTIANKI
jgi:RNA recognition motif-containing protein